MGNLTFLSNLSLFKLNKITYFHVIIDHGFWSNMGVWAHSYPITKFTVLGNAMFNDCFFSYITVAYLTMWTNFGIILNNRLTGNHCPRIYGYILLNNYIWFNLRVILINNRNPVLHVIFINTFLHYFFST